MTLTLMELALLIVSYSIYFDNKACPNGVVGAWQPACSLFSDL